MLRRLCQFAAGLFALFAMSLHVPMASADVTVLLEEPYSFDGALAGTGHTAAYLSNVCAASPTQLRPCRPGELGVVLSRYHHVGGYDWIAIPLIPYLYAVERPDEVPLFVDPKLVAYLRNQYRRKHLDNLVPDPPSAEIPGGDWVQLIGSAYDRSLYAFGLPTNPADDARFIAEWNAKPNRAEYKLVTNNCADFVHDVVTFYYPDSVWRSKFGDLGVMTPKQVAKSLTQFDKRNEELELTRYMIPQVPGTVKRSKPVRGLVDGFFHSKKYFVPLAVFQPFVAGGVATAYFLGGRFNPAQNAATRGPDGKLDLPLTKQDRKAWESELHGLIESRPELKAAVTRKGKSVFKMPESVSSAPFPVTRKNILTAEESQNIAPLLLVARIHQQLEANNAKKTSNRAILADWQQLQESLLASSPTMSASSGR